MKIVSYNLNGIRARLPRLIEYLTEQQPDVVCLQEIKCDDDSVPAADIAAAGYHGIWHGQKAFNGVGILTRDNDTYDRFHTYPIVNPGKRTTTATKSSIRFTQLIAGDPSGYGYSYTKTVKLTPGKAQLIIEDRLKNTGKKPIDTTVYNHHFMTLSPGEEAVQLEAPFALKNTRPMPADVIKFDGNRMTYLRGITGQEQVASDLTGFGASASDNDFRVTATRTGYGVRIRADRPVTRLLWWSVRGREPMRWSSTASWANANSSCARSTSDFPRSRTSAPQPCWRTAAPP